MDMERFDTIVIGAGQAGLWAGAHLRKTGRSFVILDANDRVGDAWRQRYDSLRLFTPSRYIGLPGLRFPGKASEMPTKDQMADYLESYAERFALPVRTGIHVDGVRREGDRYIVTAGDHRFEADDVIVASGAHREPRLPSIARELDPSIVQLHSTAYRNPSQLQEGGLLVVGAGNSGGDISLELSRTHPVWLSGPDRGHIPIDIDTPFARLFMTRLVVFAGRHVLTLRTPIGRRAYEKHLTQGDPLIRVKPKQLEAAGVRRVGKTVAVRDGAPVIEDGVVTSEPGLYFVGLPFQYSAASDVLPGVGRDAAYVVKRLQERSAHRSIPVEAAGVPA